MRLLVNLSLRLPDAREQTHLCFRVRACNRQGTYTFRLHADYGYGAFVGVDGAEFQGGDWAHSRSI